MGARRVLVLLAGALAVLAVACADDESPPGSSGTPTALRVASFDFAESELLAELYAQGAEQAGIPVERVGPVGPREIVAPALEQGRIDLVPEYLGTASRFFGADEVARDPLTARLDLVDRLEERELTALGVSGARDVNVVAVTSDTADQLGLRSVSDLREVAGDLRFGGPPECPERELCLRGLEATYGLVFGEFVAQPSLTFTVEALRRDEIDIGLFFSTAAELDDGDLVVLRDDRGLQPPENIVPIVRLDALERWGPELVATADAISAAMTTNELRGLNGRVDDGDAVEVVAAEWLASELGDGRDD
ncbi:MAG: ABC transporter substrate-binding protein [Actinomycetota bacterium]